MTLFLRALRHLLTAEILDNRGLLSFSCGVKHPSVTVHSQLVFEFEVTMFWGAWGVHAICICLAHAWMSGSLYHYTVVGYRAFASV